MNTIQENSKSCSTATVTFSLLLLAAGVILLLSNFNVIRVQRVWDLWPLVLIAAGLGELLAWSNRSERT